MNAIITPDIPAAITPQTTAPALVGLHLGDPAKALFIRDMFPFDHAMAAWMVARVLTLSLSNDLLLEDPAVTIFGTLGDGMALIHTRNAHQTVQSIKAELEHLQLLPLVQIGIRQPDGWQCVHPGPEVNLAPLLDIARFAKFHDQLLKKQQDQLAVLRQLFKAPPPPGPDDTPPPAPVK
jgi:hypothetical protein